MAIEVYPVVHVMGEQQTRDESDVALSTGADGVYLISHKQLSTHELLRYCDLVKRDHPDSFVGINALGDTPRRVFEVIQNQYQEMPGRLAPDGVWVDDADIEPQETKDLREGSSYLRGIKYLGGVAFKYSKHHTSDPGTAAHEASRLAGYIDVVTTTGSSTGMAPTLEKALAMKRSAPDSPLAIASGVDEYNIRQFDGVVDQVLVASSIKDSRENKIDVEKLRRLVEIAHGLGTVQQ